MSRFEFDLQRVLDVRGITKLLAEQSLAQCVKKELAAKVRLDESLLVEQEIRQTQRAITEGVIEPLVLQDLLRFRSEAFGRTKDCRKGWKESKELSHEARTHLIECSRKEQSLSKLKDRQKAEHTKRYWWAQNKALDEIASVRFSAQKRR